MSLEQALTIAYAQLNRRERTVQEMRELLLRRDVQEDTAEEALRVLAAEGYLDDARFARLFAQDKRDLDHWGQERIREALLKRGITRETAELAADDTVADDELQRAVDVLLRRFPASLDGRPERMRALGVLLRKGYEYELAVNALSEHRRQVSGAAG